MYFVIYLIVCFIAVIIGLKVYSLKRKSVSGVFFLLFTVFLSLWFLNYFLFFTDYLSTVWRLLYSSRINFIIWIITVYNLLFFVIYYGSKEPNIKPVKYIYIPSVIIFSVLYIFTWSIIETLRFDEVAKAYREVYWSAYFLTIIFYVGFLLSFIYVGFYKIRHLSNLDRIRLKKIMQAAYFMLFSMIFLQVFLPLFDIWILEREIIFFYLFFVVRTYLVLRRYYFGWTEYSIWKVLNSWLSFLISVLSTNLVYHYYLNPKLQDDTVNYWISWDYYSLTIITSWILFFQLSYWILKHTVIRKIFWLSDNTILKVFTGNLQRNISRITTYGSLHSHIQKELKNILGSDFCRIVIYKNDIHFKEMKQYFESAKGNPIFINDMVFIEENSKFFDKEKIMEEIPGGTAIVFPFYDETRANTGLFILWQKPFGDFYTIDEIDSLRQIVLFIESHLRYLKTYEQIQEFTKTLDKKVDEKTIEYNDLINKQKEFISTISHEIKSPIAGAVLQTDSIMDDIDDEKVPRTKIKEELNLLSAQLMKVGDLLSKLFSAQYYDTHSISLFKEKIQIQNMLNMELDIYESINENVEFIRKVDSSMRFIEIDKIQFQQVITNLINNAIKFANQEHPKIRIEAQVKAGKFYFSVEDNGDGFDGIEISEIFDKYAVGASGSVGLWIGLYLCKRIVEMHGGTISASIGEHLHGARISAVIPV